MKIIPLGDSALIVRVGDINAIDLHRRLTAAAIPGVIECAPAYDSVAVFYRDVLFEALCEEVERVVAQPARKANAKTRTRRIEIPVCYEGEYAADLEEVGRYTRLTTAEVVRRHSAAEYVVACLGFVPGFGYLTGLPNELSIPRRVTPRKQVPAGAVAIGGKQTGIYPAISPGGWNIIGRTKVRLFDATREPASLLRPGDRVRFRAIGRAEFEEHEITR